MDDSIIVELFLNRNENAISEAKSKYEDYCVYIADNILRDRQEAEECLNMALLAVWNSIPPQNPENLRTYLGKITRQTAIDKWKKNNRLKRVRSDSVQPLEEIEEIVSGGDMDEKIAEIELSREISKFLRSVSESKRNVFIRRYWYCDSIESICERYGFGKSKVLMMLKRTRDDLAKHLKKEGFIT